MIKLETTLLKLMSLKYRTIISVCYSDKIFLYYFVFYEVNKKHAVLVIPDAYLRSQCNGVLK